MHPAPQCPFDQITSCISLSGKCPFLVFAIPWSQRLRIVPQSVEKVERGRPPAAVSIRCELHPRISSPNDSTLLSLQFLVRRAAPVKGEPEPGADVGRRRRREGVGHEVDAQVVLGTGPIPEDAQLPRGGRADDSRAEHAHLHPRSILSPGSNSVFF